MVTGVWLPLSLVACSALAAAGSGGSSSGPLRWREACPYDDDDQCYYDCVRGEGCRQNQCAGSLVFDKRRLKCVLTHHRSKRQSAVVGASCSESTSCRRGAYCDSTKRCACLSTYTEIGGYCWKKINPGESGCKYAKQCSAVWPNSICSSGICKCGNNQPSYLTRDGPVCLNYGYCPVNGEYTKLKKTDGTVVPCSSGLDPTCPNGAHAYDCICGTASNPCNNQGPNFCCPGRDFACTMAQDAGATPAKGGGTVTRWYHNPLTGNCEKFAYRGSKGNANNFETKDQCESYCNQRCERGMPQYNPINPPASTKESIRYCTGTSSSACDSLHTCTQKGSISLCCPKPDYICSKTGGVPGNRLTGTLTTNYDPGNEDGDSTTYSRWYYDPDTKTCQSFTYTGQGGNFNNFLSQSHCEGYCAKVVCDAGEPLKDTSGVTNLQCSTSSTCPGTHSCVTEGVCCPKKQYVCSQAKATGTCGNYVERWWYNSRTRNCESFTYSGCQGNDNNFDTYTNCQTFCKDTTTAPNCPQGTGLQDSYGNYIVCGGTSVTQSGTTNTCPANYICYYDGATYGCCPTRAYTCSLSYDQGTTCGPSVSRWYYNAVSKTCQTFTYNGCDGNSNNFATQTDCQDYCGVGGCPNGGEPFKEVNGQYRSCSNGVSCPNTHFCTQVTLGSTTTYNYCCPTKTYICSLPRDSGTKCGSTTLGRYFFNSVTRNCESFNYNGCDGNRNNFASLNQCLNYCNSAGCPAGQIAATDINNNQLSTCTVSIAGSCDTSYQCTYSQLLAQNICCGAPVSADTCPAGQSAYISEITQSALQCQPNVQGSCPSGFVCFYSVAQNQYYCCGTATVQCPQGGSPYIENTTNAARQCTPGVPAACPLNYDCQATNLNIGNVLSTTGYCCGASGVCGQGYTSYNINGQPVQCAQNNPSACPSGYSCRSSPSTNLIYCCRPAIDTSIVTNVCAAYQEAPYIVSNAPVVCSTNNPSTTCPAPYQCRNYATTNTFYCCQPQDRIVKLPPTQCPPGSTAMTPIRFCRPTGNGLTSNCPTGSFCQYDPTQSRYICCGNAGGSGTGGGAQFTQVQCANGQAYAPGNDGQPLRCVLNRANNCPSSFTCTYLARYGGNFCCPSTSTDRRGCPRGTPYLYTGTNTPLACNAPGASGAQCPGGYQCVASTLYVGSFQCCSIAFRSQARTEAEEHRQAANAAHMLYDGVEGSALAEEEKELSEEELRGIETDGQERLPLAHEFGAPCSSDIQCKELSEDGVCTRGRCLCSQGLYALGDLCVSTCPEGTRALPSGWCLPVVEKPSHPNKYLKESQSGF